MNPLEFSILQNSDPPFAFLQMFRRGALAAINVLILRRIAFVNHRCRQRLFCRYAKRRSAGSRDACRVPCCNGLKKRTFSPYTKF